MNEWLVVVGSLCLSIALVEAWLLVAVLTNPDGGMAKRIPGGQDLLKSHLDYLLMALFLYAFYLLFAHFGLKPWPVAIVAMCAGSLCNAGLFLIRAIYPELKREPTAAFRLSMGVSCLLTTLGYLSGAWSVAAAAVARIS